MIKTIKNFNLSALTTFKVGGKVKFFVEAENLEQLKEAIDFAKKNKLILKVLGGGTNSLISDRGFDGLIIKYTARHISLSDDYIMAEAGAPMGALTQLAFLRGIKNFANFAGLPGTVGGAIYGNAGSFGNSIGDFILDIEAINEEGELKKINKKEIEFDYRFSNFKKNGLIILSARFLIEYGDKKEISKIMQECMQRRIQTQPLSESSAGCVFRNTKIEEISPENLKKLFQLFPDLRNISSKNKQIPASFLIDKAEFKGMKVGGVEVSQKHANFLITHKGAKAQDIALLIEKIKEGVKEKFGVVLREEVQWIGF
ncbi:MAG: UDP-N-acetylenolpyruvoylglucosamine reductase [Parcubacteria group bacterium GW2011_GWA2_39_18]|nr:MAG: UDP-N-acetylenolpyruvoylglucosamine reductase [Parcubacteria group bacterium GW2011_GWA2_39_18]